jgi:hypothetical protein
MTGVMTAARRETGLQILPDLATIREAQKFLGKYFAATRPVAAPFLSAAAGEMSI